MAINCIHWNKKMGIKKLKRMFPRLAGRAFYGEGEKRVKEGMFLWHEDLFPHLPLRTLLVQNYTCCALRGYQWKEAKDPSIQYVFKHNPFLIIDYHMKLLREIEDRGELKQIKDNCYWLMPIYRGVGTPKWNPYELSVKNTNSFPEHNNDHFRLCINKLEKSLTIKKGSHRWRRIGGELPFRTR